MIGGAPMRPQPYTKNKRQLRNAESGGHSVPQGRAHQLVSQHQNVSPENIHTSNIYSLSRLHLCI